MNSTIQPDVKSFYDQKTGSIQYVVSDPTTKKAAIIDPVWDYDEKAGQTCTPNADEIIAYVASAGLDIVWILDTHPHADHFSAAQYMKQKFNAPTAIGVKVTQVQKLWKKIYNFPESFRMDGSQWDVLFEDGDEFEVGSLKGRVIFSPGHTLASITYMIGDAAFFTIH